MGICNSNSARLSALILGLMFLLIALCSCAAPKNSAALTGVIETDDLDTNAPFTAELIALFVDDGSTVKIGDTLAILDSVSSAAGLKSAKAGYAESQARLADLQAGSDIERINAALANKRQSELTLDQAKRDLERASALHEQSLIDDKSFELATLALSQAGTGLSIATDELARLERGARVDELAAAQAALQRAEGQLIAMRDRYQKSFLIARHDGIVQLTPYQVGELVPAGRVVVTLQNRSQLWARIFVPEDKISRVTIGQSFICKVDAAPNTRFNATVIHIASETEFTPRNVQSQSERLNLVFAVKLKLESTAESELRPGMPADFYFSDEFQDSDQAGQTGETDE